MAMPADAGWYRQQTKAIGTITPSGNVVVERVTTAILADFPEVSGHFSRIPVFGSSDAYKDDYDWDGMLGAARLLSHANVDVISWNGSKGASLGFDADTVLCERIRGIRETRLSVRGGSACRLLGQFLLLHGAGRRHRRDDPQGGGRQARRDRDVLHEFSGRASGRAAGA